MLLTKIFEMTDRRRRRRRRRPKVVPRAAADFVRKIKIKSGTELSITKLRDFNNPNILT